MKITFSRNELDSNNGGGLEIAVAGFQGDTGKNPVQIFVEWYNGKLAVHLWDGSSEDAKSFVIPEAK